MSGALSTRNQRRKNSRGSIPAGVYYEARTDDPRILGYLSESGNRATRRLAKRKLTAMARRSAAK